MNDTPPPSVALTVCCVTPVGKVCPGSATGKTRDKIGEFAGVSGETVRKIEKVVDEAKAHPKKYAGLVEEMNRTGKGAKP